MKGWLQLSTEPIESRAAGAFLRDALKMLADEVVTARESDSDAFDAEGAIGTLHDRAAQLKDGEERAWCAAVSGVLSDLVQQGWSLQFKSKHLWGQRPAAGMSRDALRERLLVRRNEQLAKPSVRQFVQGMEHWRLFRGNRASIVSLLRDGRALAKSLEQGAPLSELIDPYVQFVVTDGVCDLTGMQTQDIWRYFRHTWSTPYESVPGRSLQFIVRDRAAPLHPVIGIGALSSAAVRLGPRDRFIGWDTGVAVERMLSGHYPDSEQWCKKVLADALSEIYTVDFIRDNVLPADSSLWSVETAAELARIGAIARTQHHRFMASQEYKAAPAVSTEEACVARAEMPLFRAKRAVELSKLIRLRLALHDGLPASAEGKDVLGQVVRIARSKTVGTEIADLTVCGAIAPYSHLGAGKLVAMLATSPEVVAEYHRRYIDTPGIIASSMAGRPIRRSANLCFIGTTSLYGRRPNQYDRLSMSASVVGGDPSRDIRYEYIRDVTDSRTRGVGSFQFTSKTLKGLELYMSSGRGGWKANNLFGEGTSPKLRGLRDGLVGLGLKAEDLLIHGIERCMYGVKLASNVDRYLLGMDHSPTWLFNPSTTSIATIAHWWTTRWGQSRASREDVIALVRRETLAHPIRHRGRVRVPEQITGQTEIL